MTKVFSFLFLFLGIPVLSSGQIIPYDLATHPEVKDSFLRAGFSNPPVESRLRCYWWWLNGMATKTSITRDLTEMKEKGYGGASIVDAGSSNYTVAAKTPAGPVFMSKEWMELFQHAVREADRLGIELSLNIQSGWNPGGPFVRPEHAMKKMVWSETKVSGGQVLNLPLASPEVNLFYKDIAVQAFRAMEGCPVGNNAIRDWDKKAFQKEIGWKGIYPLHILSEDYPDENSSCILDPKEIIDLTPVFQNNILHWKAPSGDWIIVRYGYTCTGAMTSTTSDGWSGLSLDHLSASAFQVFADSVIIPLIKTGQMAGHSLHYLQTDSWEMGVVSWTDLFPEAFIKYQGYDLFSYLPVLTGRMVGNRAVSNRFLHDFRQTIGKCVEENHYRLLSNLAHTYGLGIHPESGGPHSAPVDALSVMSISEIPQGEFWATANTHRINDDERLSVRQSACVAHTNGKRYVAAEGPTSIGPQWERAPKDLKGNIDRVFCSGVNRIVWHTFTSSPMEFGLPGNEYFAGTHLNPNVTWWKQAGDFVNYINRCSFMLQQGLFVADVLGYYGDEVPGFVFLKEDLSELKPGYDWDQCSREVILNRVRIDHGKIVLPDGMQYKMMMLQTGKPIDMQVLEKLDTLILQGMTLVGPRPLMPSGLKGGEAVDKKFANLVSKIWSNMDGVNTKEHIYGKGRVIWGKDVNAVLQEMDTPPDFSYVSAGSSASLDYIHRHTQEQEIYFISNRYASTKFADFRYRSQVDLPDCYVDIECKFRIAGMKPEIWNPLTGEINDLPVYQEKDGIITLPLHLVPEGSLFVVFRKTQSLPHILAISQVNQATPVRNGTYPPIGARGAGKTVLLTGYHPGSFELNLSKSVKKRIIFKEGERINLSNHWNLKFDSLWGGPPSLEIDTLKSWTLFDNSGIKYYSGTCMYLKTFNYRLDDPEGYQLMVDLGNVQEMARVTLNGHVFPGLWCAPYRCDVSGFLRNGLNELKVEVVNMWVNRLIGDSKLPLSERFTRTNVTKFNGTDSEKYLRPSGLLGPVYLLKFPVKTISVE